MVLNIPIALGIFSLSVLGISVIGLTFFEDSFSDFMNSSPYQNKLDSDSRILDEINQEIIIYTQNEDQKKLREQKTAMSEKIRNIAQNLLEIDNIQVYQDVHLPFENSSNLEPFSYNIQPICDIAPNIPIHLQEIRDTELFQMFAKKYSQNDIELSIVDERKVNSAAHYAFIATTQENEDQTALVFFDVNSCDNKLVEPDRFFISCREKNEKVMSSIDPETVKKSLLLDKFCTIPLDSWHQEVYDYGQVLSEQWEQHLVKAETMDKDYETVKSYEYKLMQLDDLSDIVNSMYHDKSLDVIEKNIQEYNLKYGTIPDKLQELLDARLPSSSQESITEEQNTQETDAKTLSEINRQAIIYQKNGDSEKFNEQMSLMQQKQKEIATEILRINISKIYIDENWNFPFRDVSDIEPIVPNEKEEELPPICGIPENIPAHLEIIRNSEMFSMFLDKYSQNYIEFEVSDERNYNSIIHYSIRAISEDQNRTAGMFVHVDSCTGEINVPYNLDCRDNTQGDEGPSNQLQTRFIDEIQSSLDNEEFCVIELEPWHEKIREYHTSIGDQLDQLTKNFEAGNEDINQKEIFKFHLEFQRLGLLNDLLHSVTSGTSEDEKSQELISEYEEKYDMLPDELVQLLEMKEQHYSSLLNK
ncbi:hypothetical protein [Nitrosopumilus sp.]|uniref:hypothetical protein n=1 Tax=Nitrosopumilus sp. TaxID=2024843 RepID=UPI0029309C76|nr:hypothetical protein [Nitrosopumilus sp.]